MCVQGGAALVRQEAGGEGRGGAARVRKRPLICGACAVPALCLLSRVARGSGLSRCGLAVLFVWVRESCGAVKC